MRSVALALLLSAALLSGCVAIEDPEARSTEADADTSGFGSEPAQEPVAPPPTQEQAEAQTMPAAPHGTPQWTNGTITTGTDAQSVPGAWARQDVSVRNGFGELGVGELTAIVSAGGILVQVEDRADYLVEATLEVRAASEQQARETLERTRLAHTDRVDGGTLVLRDEAVTDPVQGVPMPGPVTIGLLDAQVIVHITITLPLAPAISADLAASSGDVVVNGLRGASLEADTSSGDVVAQAIRVGAADLSASSGDIVLKDLVADTLEASTSSGDVNGNDLDVGSAAVSTSSGDAILRGAIDSLDAQSSSGSIDIKAAPEASGEYMLGASSGSILLRLADDGRGFRAEAESSSGDIDIELPGAETDVEDGHASAQTPGYKGAERKTEVVAETSSGDIDIRAE